MYRNRTGPIYVATHNDVIARVCKTSARAREVYRYEGWFNQCPRLSGTIISARSLRHTRSRARAARVGVNTDAATARVGVLPVRESRARVCVCFVTHSRYVTTWCVSANVRARIASTGHLPIRRFDSSRAARCCICSDRGSSSPRESRKSKGQATPAGLPYSAFPMTFSQMTATYKWSSSSAVSESISVAASVSDALPFARSELFPLFFSSSRVQKYRGGARVVRVACHRRAQINN